MLKGGFVSIAILWYYYQTQELCEASTLRTVYYVNSLSLCFNLSSLQDLQQQTQIFHFTWEPTRWDILCRNDNSVNCMTINSQGKVKELPLRAGSQPNFCTWKSCVVCVHALVYSKLFRRGWMHFACGSLYCCWSAMYSCNYELVCQNWQARLARVQVERIGSVEVRFTSDETIPALEERPVWQEADPAVPLANWPTQPASSDKWWALHAI